jgi:hypothetical protein
MARHWATQGGWMTTVYPTAKVELTDRPPVSSGKRASPPIFHVSIKPDEQRWGVYAVQLPLPLTSDAEAAAYLSALLPELVPRWTAWARDHNRHEVD